MVLELNISLPALNFSFPCLPEPKIDFPQNVQQINETHQFNSFQCIELSSSKESLFYLLLIMSSYKGFQFKQSFFLQNKLYGVFMVMPRVRCKVGGINTKWKLVEICITSAFMKSSSNKVPYKTSLKKSVLFRFVYLGLLGGHCISNFEWSWICSFNTIFLFEIVIIGNYNFSIFG